MRADKHNQLWLVEDAFEAWATRSPELRADIEWCRRELGCNLTIAQLRAIEFLVNKCSS